MTTGNARRRRKMLVADLLCAIMADAVPKDHARAADGFQEAAE